MFGTDAAITLLYPLVNKWLELLLYSLVKLPDWDVEVQVGIAHVTVSNDVNYGVRGVVAKQASLCQAIACLVDQIIELSDGYRQVVLVDTSIVTKALGDAFAP